MNYLTDIIKMAMVEIYKDLKQKNLKSHLVLTIHDELIIETYIVYLRIN